MPNVKSIKKTMTEKLQTEIVSKFDFPKSQGNQPEEILSLIDQMDKYLTKEQCMFIMEEQGCCKSGQGAEAHREFGLKYKDKTIKERIDLFDDLNTNHKAPCRLNDDGTISVYWGFGEDGNFKCVCRLISRFLKNNPDPVNISKTFCACCGGHIRNNYQNSLGVKLRLKDVVSSPISSNGKNHCELLYDVIN